MPRLAGHRKHLNGGGPPAIVNLPPIFLLQNGTEFHGDFHPPRHYKHNDELKAPFYVAEEQDDKKLRECREVCVGDDRSCHRNDIGNDYSYHCICLTDLVTPALPNKTCPASDSNVSDPGMIHFVPEENLKSHTVYTIPMVLSVCFSVLVLSILATFVFIIRRKQYIFGRRNFFCSRATDQAAVRPLTRTSSISKGIQYVTNPTYYVCAAGDTPLHKILRDIEIPQEKIQFVDEIGEGCFGRVHKAHLFSNDGSSRIVAIKVLKDCASPEAQQDFEREVQIMSSFQHDNILQLLGVVFSNTSSVPWMVFEYMTYGDLAEVLRGHAFSKNPDAVAMSVKLTRAELPSIAFQIAKGMLYLSRQHFVHRDLATRNCLVGENFTVKISDFGMSRDIYTCDYYKVGGSRMLPVRWMAPESIMYGKFTLESDIWSYGVVLWEIFTFGKQPYYGHSNEEVVKLILQGILLSPPEYAPTFICNIMAGCWKTEPRDRFTFEAIDKLFAEGLISITPEEEPQLEKEDLSYEKFTPCTYQCVKIAPTKTQPMASIETILSESC